MTITPAAHSYGAHPSQTADLYVPDGAGPFPVVMLVHGGFWRTPFDRALMVPLAQDLAARGYAVWNIDYRRVGDDLGEAGWRAPFEDVAAALEVLDEVVPPSVDLDCIGAVGHSAGGHLALWLASEFDLDAVVSQAGVADLYDAAHKQLGPGSEQEGLRLVGVPATVELLGGTPEEVPERYAFASPSALLPLETPMLLTHGDADDRVPIAQSRDFAAAAREAGDTVEVAEFPGTGHFEVLDPGHASWTATVAFLDRYLDI